VSTSTATTPADVRQWLVDRVCAYLEIPTPELDVHAPLAEIGLDSVYALALSGDVEDTFGIEIEPTVAWDYPTVDELAGAIADRVAHLPVPR
jgi:acyl carrier protein